MYDNHLRPFSYQISFFIFLNPLPELSYRLFLMPGLIREQAAFLLLHIQEPSMLHDLVVTLDD